MKSLFKIFLIVAGLLAVLHNALPHFHYVADNKYKSEIYMESIPLLHTILGLFELDLGEGHLEHITRAQHTFIHLVTPPSRILEQFYFGILLLALLYASSSQLRYFQHRRTIPVAKGIRASVRFRPPPII